MPFTVITLKKVPPALRGDLTKWMQEIDTGVYVGNFNSRIRDNLWNRVCDAVNIGEATISYTCHNEIGYEFKILNTRRQLVDCDGIPLIRIPKDEPIESALKAGFSDAACKHRARLKNSLLSKSDKHVKNSKKQDAYVVIDIETTGLDETKDQILELGAVLKDDEITYNHHLIKTEIPIPKVIENLTGINSKMIHEQGESLQPALEDFLDFIGDYPLVGYNIAFDIKFINAALERMHCKHISNSIVDLMRIVKREKLFLTDYKLQTSLKAYDILDEVPHRALEDAKLIYKLSCKVNKLGV